MKENRLPGVVLSMLILLAGNAFATEPPGAYPNDVLESTDLVKISNFQCAHRTSQQLTGRYRAETGGAISRLSIRPHGQALSVERSYQEPDVTPRRKHYSKLTARPDGSYSAAGVRLKPLRDGSVLLWERHSGLEFIPSSFWIHYWRQ